MQVYFRPDELSLYKKRRVMVHFVKSLDVKDVGEPILLHTLEGDVTVHASEDVYIMLGAHEDVYPIPKTLFERKYQVTGEKNLTSVEDVAKKNGIDPDRIEGCTLADDSFVYAKKMDRAFSVYTKHSDAELFGKAGDYYAVTYEDTENVYIVRENIMEATYDLVE